MKNELMLVESKTARESYVDKVEVLDKVKGLAMLPDNMHVTIDMTANYYEVDVKTVEKIIQRNKEELESDGLSVVPTNGVTDMLSVANISNKARNITLIPRRAVLRIGMLLRDSEIAKEIRTYLLDAEQSIPVDDKLSIIESTIGKLISDNNYNMVNMKRVLVDINKNIKQITGDVSKVESQNKELYCSVRDIESEFEELSSNVKSIKESVFFKQQTNPSYKFSELIHKLGYKLGIGSEASHFSMFYNIFEKWMGITLPKVSNTKQYILLNYDFNIIETLLNGLLVGRIVQNSKGNWIDLNGIYENEIEFRRTCEQFNNRCAYCGELSSVLIPEHVIPQSNKNGVNLVHNIIPSCIRCNKDKFNIDLDIWFPSKQYYSEKRYRLIMSHIEKYMIKNEVE